MEESCLLNVLEEIQNNKHTKINKKYSHDGLKKVWEKLSDHVKKMLQARKSVSIKNLGVFTLRKWEVNAGIYQEIKHFEPVFLLSKTLLEEFDLHQRKQYVTDNIPTTPVNTYEIASACWLRKEEVILCIDEVLQCLRRLIANGYNIQLEFTDLGYLRIVNRAVTFIFKKEIEPNQKLKAEPCQRYGGTLYQYKPKNHPCSKHKKKKIKQ